MAEQELCGHIQRRCELADLVGRRVGIVAVLQLPDIALAGIGELGQLLKAQFLLLAQRAQLVTQGGYIKRTPTLIDNLDAIFQLKRTPTLIA